MHSQVRRDNGQVRRLHAPELLAAFSSKLVEISPRKSDLPWSSSWKLALKSSGADRNYGRTS
jgi:hypothetical protein